MIRDAAISDFPAILALNREHAAPLPPLEAVDLLRCQAQGALHRVAVVEGQIVAHLMAFREDADIPSPTLREALRLHHRLLFLERIVVAGPWRRLGLGQALAREAILQAITWKLESVLLSCPPSGFGEAQRRLCRALGFDRVREADGLMERTPVLFSLP